MAADVVAIAHRGASGVLPENTKHAFVKAIDLGAAAIEFDVQLTLDEVPVVIHDETLERTTNGEGRVGDMGFDELGKLDAGSWFGASFARVEVPTLDEVLATIGGRVVLNVELKPDHRIEALVKHAITVVARRDLLDSVVFSSFDTDAVKLVRQHVPEARIGVLCTPGRLEPALALAGHVGAETIHPAVAMVDSELIARAHEQGWKVWAWTANEPGEIALLTALGVDGIFSDYPDRVVAIARSGPTALSRQRRLG